MKMSAIIIAAALGAVATPVIAADQPAVHAKYDAKSGKYCVSQEITGSRIAIKDCRTREEWAQDGAPAKQAQATKLAQR